MAEIPSFVTDADSGDSSDAFAVGAYRSGVAARLAGLSVETLRVWERRYSVSAPQRSAHGQRLYSGEQVRRLGLIKRLVDQGHPIGALAALSFAQLAQLELPHAVEVSAPAYPMRVALVGTALVRRMATGGRGNLAFDVLRTCDNLDGAAQALNGVQVDVLLIELSELAESALLQIGEARQAVGAAAVVVLYRFCASVTIRQLRSQGYLVARVPPDLEEIVLLCETALAAHPSAVVVARGAGAVPGPRRLDEQALTELMAAGNKVECECPRHLSEILLMLGSFERYSAQCGASNPHDALLHQDMLLAAGQAREILEFAMERLARAEGLPLPVMRPPGVA